METTIIKTPKKQGAKKASKNLKINHEKLEEIAATESPAVVIAQPQEPESKEDGQFVLVDNWPRGPLIEGRSYGIAFAFAKRDGNTIETVGPLSPCKDYLNDQVYSEHTGKPFGAYGYKAEKRGLFENTDVAYIVMAILPYKYGNKYAAQDKETEWFNYHFKDIQKFINATEDLLKLDKRTVFHIIYANAPENTRIISIIPYYWAQWTYRISMWTLLVRFALESFWVEGDVMEACKNCKTSDGMRMANALPKLKRMIEGQNPPQNWEANIFWHDEGIVSFKFPDQVITSYPTQ